MVLTYHHTSLQKATGPPKQNMMLPPIPPSTLRENPQFAQLYRHLTTNILAPDGSMKPSLQEAQEREQVAEVFMPMPITTSSFKNFPLRNHLLISMERTIRTSSPPKQPSLKSSYYDNHSLTQPSISPPKSKTTYFSFPPRCPLTFIHSSYPPFSHLQNPCL